MYTIKDGKIFAYSESQKELYDQRISEEGHVAATERQAMEIANPPEHLKDILERVKSEMRVLREPMLSAVTGIGWEVSEAGNDALVQEARNIRNALRDITDDPALNAAQTYEEMRAAGYDAFRRIAVGASDAFSATFREFK